MKVFCLSLFLLGSSAYAHTFKDTDTYSSMISYQADHYETCGRMFIEVSNFGYFNYPGYPESHRGDGPKGSYVVQMPATHPLIRYGKVMNYPPEGPWSHLYGIHKEKRRFYGFLEDGWDANYGVAKFRFELGDSSTVYFRMPTDGPFGASKITLGEMKKLYNGRIISMGCTRPTNP